MWLAHGLTLARIPLAGLFWLSYGRVGWSLAIVMVAALTDALDGAVARRAHARSGRPQDVRGTAGEWLDPLADKVFVLVALGVAVAHGASWPLAVIALAREIVLVPLAIAYRLVGPRVPHAFQADALGKLTTIVQLAAVVAIVAELPVAPPLAFASGALGVAAAAHYVVRATATARVAS
ncbi:MAG: CDP-alcohol phosphatidyltransferase family protein [Acidobacteriota bacterium]